MKQLSNAQIRALRHIREHGPVEIGRFHLGTVKALESRGFVQTHSSGKFVGALAHHITPEGKAVLENPKMYTIWGWL